MSSPSLDPPNFRCDSCGDTLTDAEMDLGTDDDGGLCNDCYRSENEDPDTMLGGHDNPYPSEGEDCFETAMWNANPPPAPYEHDWS